VSFWVYILRCRDGAYYTGHTDDLEKRIAQHESGEIEGFTSGRGPFTLVYSSDCGTREEALAFERRVKGWSRAKKKRSCAVIGLRSRNSPTVSVRPDTMKAEAGLTVLRQAQHER